MKGDRTELLHRAVDEDRQRLDAAVAALKRAAVAELGLGRHVARAPWAWVLAAGAAGAWLGFRSTKR